MSGRTLALIGVGTPAALILGTWLVTLFGTGPASPVAAPPSPSMALSAEAAPASTTPTPNVPHPTGPTPPTTPRPTAAPGTPSPAPTATPAPAPTVATGSVVLRCAGSSYREGSFPVHEPGPLPPGYRPRAECALDTKPAAGITEQWVIPAADPAPTITFVQSPRSALDPSAQHGATVTVSGHAGLLAIDDLGIDGAGHPRGRIVTLVWWDDATAFQLTGPLSDQAALAFGAGVR